MKRSAASAGAGGADPEADVRRSRSPRPRLSTSAKRRLAERVVSCVDTGWLKATEVLQMMDAVPARQIMKTGMLKKMFAEKGFGFVTADDGPKIEFLVHVKRNPALAGIDRGGAAVIFDLEWDVAASKYIGVNCEVTGDFTSTCGGGGGNGGDAGRGSPPPPPPPSPPADPRDAGAAASGFQT